MVVLKRPLVLSIIAAALFVASDVSVGHSAPSPAAQPPEVNAGRLLARRYCGECHATGVDDLSALQDAPPFRTFYRNYPAERFRRAIQDGLLVSHPRMPLKPLDPDELDYLTAYVASLAPGAVGASPPETRNSP